MKRKLFCIGCNKYSEFSKAGSIGGTKYVRCKVCGQRRAIGDYEGFS